MFPDTDHRLIPGENGVQMGSLRGEFDVLCSHWGQEVWTIQGWKKFGKRLNHWYFNWNDHKATDHLFSSRVWNIPAVLQQMFSQDTMWYLESKRFKWKRDIKFSFAFYVFYKKWSQRNSFPWKQAVLHHCLPQRLSFVISKQLTVNDRV